MRQTERDMRDNDREKGRKGVGLKEREKARWSLQET
jgi:hypothetical protein